MDGIISLPDLFEKLLGDDKDSWPAEATLLAAAYDGNLRRIKEIAAALDDEGAGIAATVARTAFHGMNALHAAKGLHVYRYLVEVANMDVNKPDTTPGRKTPLERAIDGGDLPTLNKVMSSCQATPLSAALFATSLPCVKLLIQAGADVNATNSPLALAAESGLTEVIKSLLEAGANPNCPDTHGRMPIELAAVYGTREAVEILFPLTNPIPTVADWSVDGLITYAKLENKKLEDDDYIKTKMSDLKQKGDKAFEEQDYERASACYTLALEGDPCDATMLLKRCLCWLRMDEGKKAVKDATRCAKHHPNLSEAYHRLGEALMLVKDYEKACVAFTRGIELDPESDEMDKLFWEAMDLKN